MTTAAPVRTAIEMHSPVADKFASYIAANRFTRVVALIAPLLASTAGGLDIARS